MWGFSVRAYCTGFGCVLPHHAIRTASADLTHRSVSQTETDIFVLLRVFPPRIWMSGKCKTRSIISVTHSVLKAATRSKQRTKSHANTAVSCLGHIYGLHCRSEAQLTGSRRYFSSSSLPRQGWTTAVTFTERHNATPDLACNLSQPRP